MSSATLLMHAASTYAGTAWAYKAATAAGLPTSVLESVWPHILLAETADPYRECPPAGDPIVVACRRTYDPSKHSAEAERWWQERCQPRAPMSAWWLTHKDGARSVSDHNASRVR